MKKALIPIALAAVLLTGCSSADESAAEPAPEETNLTSVPEEAPEDLVEEVPGHDKVSRFGTAVPLNGDVTVNVEATGYHTVAGKEGVALFQLTLSNAGGTSVEEPIKLTLTYGPNNENPELVADPDAGIGGSVTSLLPGEEKSVTVGALVPENHSSLVRAEVADPAGGEPAVFLGAIPVE